MAQNRVSHSEHTERVRVLRLLRDQFGRFGSRAGKCSARRCLIAPHLSNYAFAPDSRKRDSVLITPIDRQHSQPVKRTIEIALAQRFVEPRVGYVFGLARIFSDDCLYRRDQRARVGMPLELHPRT